MKRNKKIVFSIISIVLVILIIIGIAISIDKSSNSKEIDTELQKSVSNTETIETSIHPKNIILMIGDGMGPNHIEAAKTYFDLKTLNMENLSILDGKVSTFSYDNWVTDSAAAATAMSTGTKVYNESVAKMNNENIENMCEYAMTFGKKTGIITTTTIYDATPASFSAHADNRKDKKTIVNYQLESDINLFISGSKNNKLSNNKKVETYGYTYTDSLSEFQTTANTSDSKLFASFNGMSWNQKDETNENPSLSSVSLTALDYLERISGDDGFFLMIEGADIDTYSHMNKFNSMVNELYGFDETVNNVVNWANKKEDTLVIVTADHECGNLTYSNESKELLNNKLFKSKDHTGQAVRVFFYCVSPFSEEYWNSLDNKLDNTNISEIIRQSIYNYSIQKKAE